MALTEWTDWRTVNNWYNMQKGTEYIERSALFAVSYDNGRNTDREYDIYGVTYAEKDTMSLSNFGMQYRMKMARNQKTGIMRTLYQFRLIIGDNKEGFKPPVRVDGLKAASILKYNATSKEFENNDDSYYAYGTAFILPWVKIGSRYKYGYWDDPVPESEIETDYYSTGGAPAFPVYTDESTEFDPDYSVFGSSYDDNRFGTVSTFQIRFASDGTLRPDGNTASESTTISPTIEFTVPCYPAVSALVLPSLTTSYKFGDTYKTELYTWWPDGSKVDVDMRIGGVSVKTISFEDDEKSKHEYNVSLDPNSVGQYVTDSMDTTVNVITTTRIKINGVYEELGEHTSSPTWSFKNYDLSDRISTPSPIRYNSVDVMNDWPFGVTGKSGYEWNITASEMYSSPITATVDVRRNSNETYKTIPSLSGTTEYLTKPGTYSIFVSVKDGRGMEGKKEFSLGEILDDGLPSIDKKSISRANASGQETEAGRYGLLDVIASPFVINYSGTRYNSIASITATYKTKGAEPKTYTATKTQSDFPYLIPNINDIESGSITDYELLPADAYSIEITVTDILGNMNSATVNLSVARTTFHLRKGGNGIGLGQYCDVLNTVQSAWPIFVLGRELSHCDATIDQKTNLVTEPHNGAYIRIKTPGTYMLIGVSDRTILTDDADHLRDGVDFRVRPFSGSTTPTFHLKSFYAPFDSTINSELKVIPKTIGIALFRLVEGSVEAMVKFGVLDTTAEEGNTMWSQYQNENSTLYAFRLGQYIELPHDEGL